MKYINRKIHIYYPLTKDKNKYTYLFSINISTIYMQALQADPKYNDDESICKSIECWIKTYLSYLDIRDKDINEKLKDKKKPILFWDNPNPFWLCFQCIPNTYSFNRTVSQRFFSKYPLLDESDLFVSKTHTVNGLEMQLDVEDLAIIQGEPEALNDTDYFLYVGKTFSIENQLTKSFAIYKGEKIYGYD